MKFLNLKQGSAEWSDARLMLPTASQFHRIITPKKMQLSSGAETYRDELLAEWILGYPVVDAESGFMQRGTDMENDARDWYELRNDVEILPGGFCLTDDGRAGCSPDGFVGEDGGVEIKCPNVAKHIGYLLDGLDDAHRCQVQGCLAITGRKWWDVVIYGPSLPALVVRTERNEEFIGKLWPALTQFCEMLDKGKRDLLAQGVRAKLASPPMRGLELVA